MADLKAKRQPPRPSARELFFQGKLILNGKNGFTVIPEGGVLRLPKAHQARVAAKQPEGPLQPWPVFLQENRDWLGAEEVPLSVARGVPSLLDPVLARLAGEKRVIVSTYRKEPIGIMHPAEDEAPDPPAAQKP